MALPVRDFIIQRLLEYDPNFDVGAGVPTTSLLIDPLSIILQPIVDELTNLQETQSILTILEADDPDAFPEDIVDGLASNVFVDRNPGSIGSDVQRLRFFEPQAFSSQQSALIFRGPSGQRYTNSESVSVTEAEMSLNQDGSLYYVDIPIVAVEEGSTFNVDAGQIVTLEAEPVNVANTANLFGVAQGADRETNTELIDRIRVAVTVRALVTGRGIIVTLTEAFPTIDEITPIGFGDPEMMRDIVFNTHIGGNVDVYVKTPSWISTFQDVTAIPIDTTRTKTANATIVALEESVGYPLGRAPVSRDGVSPSAKAIDGAVTFGEGGDYSIDDLTGLFFRLPGSNITHIEFTGANITATDELEATAPIFGLVRAGMVVTIDTPITIAGTYTVKSLVSASKIQIYGTFGVGSASGVGGSVDENVVVTFGYNPVSIDVIAEPRSTAREPFTIQDVPLMFISSIEVLDPVSGETTGTFLSNEGGYGTGGYGTGGYGAGMADYKLAVNEPTLRHSAKEDNVIELTDAFLGFSLRISYDHASAIPPIQSFAEDESERTVAASILIRHYIPVYVDGAVPIVYDINAADEETAVTVDEMTTLLLDFITDVDQGSPLELSDLVDLFYDNGAVRVDLGTVQQLKGEIHNHDGSIEFTLPTSEGNIEIPDNPIPDPTNKPLSQRIARFRGRDITLQRNLV